MACFSAFFYRWSILVVNFAFSSLQLQRQRQPSQATTNGEEEGCESSSPNHSEIIVPDYTVDSVGSNTVVVVDLLRRFPSDLIETSVDPEPPLMTGDDVEMEARVNNKQSFLSSEGLI